jgi:hypothetical protein
MAWCAMRQYTSDDTGPPSRSHARPNLTVASPARKMDMMTHTRRVVQMRFRNQESLGIAGLLLGAVMVGIAIALDGTAGRVVNGVGGVLWFGSTAMLTVAVRRAGAAAWRWGLLALVTITVAFVVTPSAAVPTLIGFIPAGFLMAAVTRRSPLLWAALVPAWYLPAHIGTAILRSAVRSMMGQEASVRTDPPPTAAFVPTLMVICALLGGWLATRLINSHRTRELSGELTPERLDG